MTLQPIHILTWLIFSFVLSLTVEAAEWHGLKPGQSTRSDVVREFGACTEGQRECEFNLADEDVFIYFADAESCPTGVRDRVLLIQRDLVHDASFTSLHLNDVRFKKFDPSWPRGLGYGGFINDESGLAVKTFNRQIIQVAYFPTVKERQFCPGYYTKPREFIIAPVEHAPIVHIKCPKYPVLMGERVVLTVWYLRGLSVFVNWNATAGTIVEGQGRRRMTLDTSGVSAKTIKVTIERMDSTGRDSADSCEIQLKPVDVVAHSQARFLAN